MEKELFPKFYFKGADNSMEVHKTQELLRYTVRNTINRIKRFSIHIILNAHIIVRSFHLYLLAFFTLAELILHVPATCLPWQVQKIVVSSLLTPVLKSCHLMWHLFKGGSYLKIGYDKEIVITGPLENSGQVQCSSHVCLRQVKCSQSCH